MLMRVFHGAYLKHNLALFTGHVLPEEGAKAKTVDIQINHSGAASNEFLAVFMWQFAGIW